MEKMRAKPKKDMRKNNTDTKMWGKNNNNNINNTNRINNNVEWY